MPREPLRPLCIPITTALVGPPHMCTPSAPKAAPIVTPPPPSQLAKPLGIDDDMGVSGLAALRTAGRNGLAIAGGGRAAGVPGLSIPMPSGSVSADTGSRSTIPSAPRGGAA